MIKNVIIKYCIFMKHNKILNFFIFYFKLYKIMYVTQICGGKYKNKITLRIIIYIANTQ